MSVVNRGRGSGRAVNSQFLLVVGSAPASAQILPPWEPSHIDTSHGGCLGKTNNAADSLQRVVIQTVFIIIERSLFLSKELL